MSFTEEFLTARFEETFENGTDVFSISLARGVWTNASASSQALLASSECFGQRAGISSITKAWDNVALRLNSEFLSTVFQAPLMSSVVFDRALLWRNGGTGNQWLDATVSGQNIGLPAGHGLVAGSKVYVPEPVEPDGLYFVKTITGSPGSEVATLSATLAGPAIAFSGASTVSLRKVNGLICGGYRLGATFTIPANTTSVIKLAGTSYGL